MRSRHRQHGFTMVEVLVVLAIMGVLAAAVMPLGQNLMQARKERELRAALWMIRDAIDNYKRAVDEGVIAPDITVSGYPVSLEALVDGVPTLRHKTGEEPNSSLAYFLRKIPVDPFAAPDLPPGDRWLLRSYASPANEPEAGEDVYDIKSSSSGIALDGSRYASW